MKLIEELDTSTKKDIIIEGLMRSKGVYLLVSKPKVGKSMLALQLSYCITNGLPFLGHKVIPSPVLYISTESDFGQLQDRYKTLGLTPKKDSLFIIDRDGKPNISILDHEDEIADFSSDKTTNKLVIIDMDLGVSLINLSLLHQIYKLSVCMKLYIIVDFEEVKLEDYNGKMLIGPIKDYQLQNKQ